VSQQLVGLQLRWAPSEPGASALTQLALWFPSALRVVPALQAPRLTRAAQPVRKAPALTALAAAVLTSQWDCMACRAPDSPL
jgi:hypothetical protein